MVCWLQWQSQAKVLPPSSHVPLPTRALPAHAQLGSRDHTAHCCPQSAGLSRNIAHHHQQTQEQPLLRGGSSNREAPPQAQRRRLREFLPSTTAASEINTGGSRRKAGRVLLAQSKSGGCNMEPTTTHPRGASAYTHPCRPLRCQL